MKFSTDAEGTMSFEASSHHSVVERRRERRLGQDGVGMSSPKHLYLGNPTFSNSGGCFPGRAIKLLGGQHTVLPLQSPPLSPAAGKEGMKCPTCGPHATMNSKEKALSRWFPKS